MTKKVTALPEATDVGPDDVIHVVDVAAGLSEKVTMGALGLVDNNARFRVRDDFVPALVFATYTDSGAAFSVHADNISDEAGEGFGVRRLETAGTSSRDAGEMFSGGLTDLIMRTRFRIVSDPANIAVASVGILGVGGTLFGIVATLGSTNKVAIIVVSAAGGSAKEIESATAFAQNTWYEVEVRINSAAKTVDFYLDGVAVSLDFDATNSIPEATEDMGFGYELEPSSGTAIVEIDYIEVIGKRW